MQILTVDEAVVQGLIRNPGLRAARREIGIAEGDVISATLLAIAEFIGSSVGTAHLRNVVYGVKPLMWELVKNDPVNQLRARMAYQNIQQETRNDRQERMEIEAELNGLLGYPQETRVLIKDTLDPQPIPISYEDLKQSIMSRNLDVKTALASPDSASRSGAA